MPALTAADRVAQLCTLTKLSAEEWNDFLACTPEQQKFLVEGYRDLDWAKSPDTLEQVLAVLLVLGNIATLAGGVAGGVSGVAGAIAALKAL